MASPGSPTALGRLADLVRPPDFPDEDQNRAASFISTVAVCAITALLIGAVFALARTNSSWLTAGLLVATGVLISGALWLVHRRALAAASWVVFVVMTTLTTSLVFMGRSRGLEDIAMMLYPALVIFASVLLGRRGFVIGFALILTILSAIFAAELLGHLNSWPSAREPMADFAHAVLIVAMSGVASYLLSDGLLKSIEKQRAAARALVAAAKTRGELIAALEARNAELERFTYTVSHDLKSPLITIGGFLGYLEAHAEAGEVEKLRSDLERISEAQRTMLRLLNELLELSRVGRKMGAPEDVPFAEIVKEARNRAEGPLRNRRVKVLLADNLPVVRGDRERLVELMQNLLTNAAKFSGDAPDPRVEVGVRAGDDGPVFFVTDNGIGIGPTYLDRVFGLFEKLDPSMEGTGIGLALVKRIVEVHGGRVWAESEGIGCGTTVCFTLPHSETATP